VRDTLADLAAAEIDRLTEQGYALLPSEVIEINARAWDVLNGRTREQLCRGDWVDVGGVRLWPLTLQAAAWHEKVGETLRGDAGWRALVLAWAMAHCYTSGRPYERRGLRARLAVLRWSMRLRCRIAAIEAAVLEVLAQDQGPDMPPSETARAVGIGDVSVLLAARSDQPPEFWEERCSSSYGFAVLRAIADDVRAQAGDAPQDERIQAEIALGWAIAKVKERAKVSGGNAV